MKKYKLKGSLATLKDSKKVPIKNTLPPLSTESYVFTEKKLQKKTKQVQSALQQAESLIVNELGHTNQKKKKILFRDIKK